MADFVIVGSTLVDSEGKREGLLRVEGERIAEVIPGEVSSSTVESLSAEHGCEVIDGDGLWLIPGGVDPHVHFALPVANTRTADDFVTGSRAALVGGTTTIIDFITPAREKPLLEAAVERKREAAECACDYMLHASVTSWRERTPHDLRAVVDELGVRSVKMYLAYLETMGLQGESLEAALCCAEELGLTVLLHCEDGKEISRLQRQMLQAGRRDVAAHARSRPPETEERSVRDALALTRQIGCTPYLVHLSTAGAVEAVVEARDKGQTAYAETCPQYLLLDDIVYERPFDSAAPFVMSPPLRPPEHKEALLKAVADGQLDVVATDHCSFDLESKRLGKDDFTKIPGGAGGVQHRLALLYTLGVAGGLLDARDWVRLVSEKPARIFGLYPQKGSLEVGADADLLLWDPEASQTICATLDHHRADTCAFEGLKAQGRAWKVWSRGDLVVNDGQVLVSSGRGRYLGH